MKVMWELLPPFIKGAVAVVVFFISLGWASYGAVLLVVKAEGEEIEARVYDIENKVMTIRKIDMEHLDKRFDQIEKLVGARNTGDRK